MITQAEILPESQIEKALRVRVLGSFEVQQGNRVITNEQWRGGKARSLFKIMLSRRGYQISRQEATGLLWPEQDLDRASNNLNQAVYSLRRSLEPELKQATASAYLKTDGSTLQLNSNLISWVDLEEFKRLGRQARVNGGDLSIYEEAASLYRGDYLPEDLYEDWSVSRREAVRQEWIDLLLEMAVLYQKQGQDEKYQQCLHRVLETDFSNEGAVQGLMKALAESGRREESLTFYRNFAAKLQSRLSIEPLAETRKLYQDIMAGKVQVRVAPNNLKPLVDSSAPVQTLERNALEYLQLKKTIRNSSWRNYSANEWLFGQMLEMSGRRVEQMLWQECLREVNFSGKGGFTLILGEAGIGKTHLAQVLAQQARKTGFEVLYTTCCPEQAELPYSPISELLEQALDHLDEPELVNCLQYSNPELLRLLPGLSHLLPATEPATGESSLQSIFAATAQVLSWLGHRRRIALVLDDLQYMSGLGVRLLHYLLTHPSLKSLVVLGTMRPVGGDAAHPELSRLFSWATQTPQMVHKLERLERPELEQCLSTRLRGPISENLLERACAASGGNPRLALDLAMAWLKENRVRLQNGRWELVETRGEVPFAVASYIKRIVAGLNTEAQVLLLLASLIGETFSFEVLRQIVLHRSDGAGWWIELDKTRLGKALIEVTGCGLVEEQGVEYRFVYPMLAETLKTSLPYSQRQCWREVINWAKGQIDNSLPNVEGYNFDQV